MKFIVLLIAFVSISALADFGKEGGGQKDRGGYGGAYVCRNASDVEVNLVDLFEAEANGHKIKFDDETSIEKQVEGAIAKLTYIYPWFGQQVTEAWNIVRNQSGARERTEIPAPTDVDAKYSMAGCPLEGIMYFDDEAETLVKNPALYNAQKGKTRYAASELHEAIYKAMRDNRLPGAVSSRLTRRLVGCLFAEGDAGVCLRLVKSQIPPKFSPVWQCNVVGKRDIRLSFYAYGFTKFDPLWRLMFTKIDGVDLPYATMGQVSLAGRIEPYETGYFIYNHGGRGIYKLDGLGNPVGHAFDDVRILKGNPLTIRVEGSRSTHTCSRVQ